ncbi:hypothetical protein BGZ89_006084 [Linnemannia elongata]|nr:hypothetical protein BGZ89_006084 [Linnemannia elongata]
MSQMQRARNLNPSSLESINQPLFLSPDVIEYPQDEGNMPTLDHGQHHHQEHYFFLTPTVISYNNEEEDDMTNLDDHSSSVFVDPAASPYDHYSHFSQHLYYDGYEYYEDEHYDSIGGLIHLHNTPMTLADYTNASTSNSTGLKL